MTTAPVRYSPTLVRQFYIAYRGDLKRQCPQENIWKGSDSISSITIHKVQVNISLRTNSRFLHGLDFKLPVNTRKIDYLMEKMQKLKRKQIGSK